MNPEIIMQQLRTATREEMIRAMQYFRLPYRPKKSVQDDIRGLKKSLYDHWRVSSFGEPAEALHVFLERLDVSYSGMSLVSLLSKLLVCHFIFNFFFLNRMRAIELA